jgi:hypothetical protein
MCRAATTICTTILATITRPTITIWLLCITI